MAAATGLVIVKRFDYRGNPNEEWSNQYWLTGAPPGPSAEWKALTDILIEMEKTLYSAGTHVTRAYGYNDNERDEDGNLVHPSVWSYDYGLAGEEVAGILADPAGHIMAGDQAGTCWWKTSRRTSRGKWIYLRKFFHDGFINNANTDAVSNDQATVYRNFTNALSTPNSNAMQRGIQGPAGPETLQAWGESPWATTRTLKRRGRRP